MEKILKKYRNYFPGFFNQIGIKNSRIMHQKLISETFKKIKEKEKKATGIEPSNNKAAKILSDYIHENQNIPFGERRLLDYHRLSQREDNKEVIITQPKVVKAMWTYLGYKNFSDFKKAHGISETEIDSNHDIRFKSIDFLKKNKRLIGVSMVIIMIVSFVYSVNKQRWMIWEKDRYVETVFDSEKYRLGQLKLYDEYIIENFRKVSVDCETEFFNREGKVKIWYGKNRDKELEFFTLLEFHPETDKTLKAITPYMINKYVCLP